MLFLALLLAIFLSAEANASLNCSIGPVGNGLGDVIHGQITLHLRSGSGFSWNVIESSSGQAVTWDPGETESCGLNCNQTFPWKYTAGSVNETFTAWQSPSTGDTCDLMITSIDPYVRGTPIPKYVKDGATNLAANTSWWNDRLSVLGTGCLAWGTTPFGASVCITLAGVGLINIYRIHQLNDMAGDPPEPWNCQISQDPEWVSADKLGIGYAYRNLFGDGGIEWHYNSAVDELLNMYAYGRMAFKSANAASGCLELGDTGDADWQINNARWAVNQYADHAYNLSSYFYGMGWYFENYWNPPLAYDYPCDPANWQYYADRPDVEQNDYYGPNGPFGTNGAIEHYYAYGYNEGMTYHSELCPVTDTLSETMQNLAWIAHEEG